MSISPFFRPPAFVCLGALTLLVSTAQAEVTLFPLFSDHAVLQASDKVPVWGKAAPGEAVTVTLGDDKAKATATAGKDGKWTATLDLKSVGQGPFELIAAGPGNRVAATDVVVGEVWLCSGQSNMEFSLKNSAGATEEIARSANPMLRQFQVTKAALPEPTGTVIGKWVVASPETSGGFTAVGYYFGKKIQGEIHAPVGLVHSSWGGTPSEAWTSTEALATDPGLKEGSEKARANAANFEKYKPAYRDWLTQLDRQDHPQSKPTEFTTKGNPDGGWKTVTLPGKLAASGLPDAGAVWVQRTVTVAEGGFGHGVDLMLGEPHGVMEVYWNGKKIGAGDFPGTGARQRVGGQDVKTGENTLALRLFEPAKDDGLTAGPAPFQAVCEKEKIPLDGPWLAKAEFALPPLPADAPSLPTAVLPTVPQPHTAAYLYNGMISPLVPYALRGAIWYQGESNAGRAAQYRTAFPLMIKDWRTHWGRGDFPFYFCQLASYQARQPEPGDSGWAELRDAQTSTLALPATGEAILIDVGEEGDIHPKDKLNPGERLARIALAKDYGKTVVWSGPTLEKLTVEGGKARLKFQHADGGLVATPIAETYRPQSLLPQTRPNVRRSPGGTLEGFAVCGADKVWKWATSATIDGDSVVLTCADVPAPVAVRYAWADSPLCNLANGAGLPAGPFRTDDFPPVTGKGKY